MIGHRALERLLNLACSVSVTFQDLIKVILLDVRIELLHLEKGKTCTIAELFFVDLTFVCGDEGLKVLADDIEPD